MRCLSCKYDLRNLFENRCPECGREFDPARPSTFETDVSRRADAFKTACGWIICVYIAGFLISAAWLSRYGLDTEEHAILAAVPVISLSPILVIYLLRALKKRS